MAKIGIISLGCPRNLVDSEVMAGLLKKRGFIIADDIGDSDIAVVNTCAFIKDAIDESIDTILALAELKKKKRIKSVVVTGCLAQRYKEKLKKELKDVDAFIGTGDIERINSVISRLLNNKSAFFVSDEPRYIYDDKAPRSLITPPHYAYIKIQEGCSNRCSYCVIPKLRGDLRSRPMKSILNEARTLLEARNVSELNIIGQDTTNYGADLYKKPRIAKLLTGLSRLAKDKVWIRLLYTHPAHYTDELISAINDNGNIAKYMDLPIQHISDNVLTRMNRMTPASSIRSLIENLRKDIPGLAIRTTLIVGFPGESDSDFEKLYSFIKDARFERLGVFSYSNEEGAPSYDYKDQIPENIKRERMDAIMALQQKISEEYNKSFLGKTIEVLIDELAPSPSPCAPRMAASPQRGEGILLSSLSPDLSSEALAKEEGGEGCEASPQGDKGEGEIYLGRTQHDAPSVDGQVYVKGRNLKIGSFVRVKITDTIEYDLVGEVVP